MHLTTESLLTCLETFTVRGSYAVAAARCGCAEPTLFYWLHKSKKAQSERDTSSPFYLHWRDQNDYWHAHVARARRENIMSLEALVRDEARNGQTEYVRDPSTQRRIPQLDPRYLSVSDEAMIDSFLDPVRDRWLWQCNDAGERTEPLWETKSVPVPASLRATVLRAMLPKTYGERATVDHNINAQHVVWLQPAPFVKQERIASAEITDAEFTEVQERPDIAELRARAAKLLATPLSERQTVPEGIVRDGSGEPVNVGRKRPIEGEPNKPDEDDVPLHKPDIPLRQHPRAYDARPEPAPQPRSYSEYPANADPRKVGAHAMKITR